MDFQSFHTCRPGESYIGCVESAMFSGRLPTTPTLSILKGTAQVYFYALQCLSLRLVNTQRPRKNQGNLKLSQQVVSLASMLNGPADV